MDGDRGSELSPSQKGGLAELAIAKEAARLRMDVYRPVLEGSRCDLILGLGPQLLRVQCKCGSLDSGVIKVRIGTCRLTPTHGYVRTTYGAEEVDAVAVYCADLDKCYLLPIALTAGRSGIYLRVAPSLNTQAIG